MDKIRDVWTGDLDTLLDTLQELQSLQQELQQKDEAQEQNTPQAEVKNEEEEDKPIIPTENGQTEDSHGGNESTAQTDSTTNMEEDGDNGTEGREDRADETESEDQDKDEAQNTPQAEVKNEEEEEDKPIIPTENGQTEDSHGGNESTAQTDSTTNMEEDGDNGTQGGDNGTQGGGQDRAEDETEYEDQEDYAGSTNVGEINAEGFEAMDSDAEELRQAKYVAKYFKQLLENLGSEVVFEVPGTDQLDMRAVIKRAVTKAPLWHCYKDEIKNQVLVLIDNSGSMYHSSLLMKAAYETASRMQNVQAFYMPNGQFDYRLSDKEKRQIEQAMAAAQVVLYIGDFDGADLPIELAYAGKEVLWVCPEMARYERIEDHDWVSYTQADLAKLSQRLWIYWVDGVKPIEQEYVQAFKDAMLRRRTKRVATFTQF